MSWLFGAFGTIPASDRQRLASLSPRLFHHATEQFMIAGGGIEETCTYHLDEHSGFVVCGKAISADPGTMHFLGREEWSTLAFAKEGIAQLNGHFAGVSWRGGQLHFFADTLGIRRIILYQTPNALYFTTNEELLPRIIGITQDINWKAFSSRWLLTSQLSLASIIDHAIRLTSGAQATYDGNVLTIHQGKPIEAIPEPQESCESIRPILDALMTFSGKEAERSISLSGGMDSRLMLSFLLKDRQSPFRAYTFDHPTHPDATITTAMARDLAFAHQVDTPSIPEDVNILLAKLRKYCTAKQAISHPLHFIASLPYDRFAGEHSVLIDGGFGEIGRRRHHERIRLRNAQELLSGDPAKLLPLFQRKRADIFNSDLTRSLNEYAHEQFAEYLASVPSARELGIDQWIDLMSVRVRLPNYNAYEQTRLDGITANYCVFTQPIFVRSILRCPIARRRNAALYREIITTNCSQLNKYPLVKFEATYPYRFNAAGAHLWTSAKRKLGMAFKSDDLHTLLRRLEVFIRDLVSSNEVRSFAAYDGAKIQLIVDNYYNGKQEYASQLGWWLSFELWRQSLTAK